MLEKNALAVGTQLDEYVIEAVLGAGGFGITYRAIDVHLDTAVAIKEYCPMGCATRAADGVSVQGSELRWHDPEATLASDYAWGLDRFLDEARALARIEHPLIVQIKRYFRANGTAYIVMNYEEGEPLSSVLQRQNTLNQSIIVQILGDILSALEAVHEQGYLHRDIKPANLYMRSRDGRTMLIDFGAARMAFTQATQMLTGLVTQGYSPPEQYATDGAKYGSWSDIYALGAVLYRCIAGNAPPSAAERLLEDNLRPAVQVGANRYDPRLLKVIDRALALRPEQRFTSIQEMREWVKDLFEDVAEDPVGRSNDMPTTRKLTDFTPPVATSCKRKTSPWLFGLATGFVLAGVMGGLWWYVMSTDSSSPVPRYVLDENDQIAPNPNLASEPASVIAATSPTDQELAPPASMPGGEAAPETEPELAEDVISEDVQQGEAETEIETAVTQEEIDRWLELAAARLGDYKLTTPEQDNALFYYQQVLDAHPDNQAALQGISEIPLAYLRLAQNYAQRGQRSKAQEMIDRGLGVEPNHSDLLTLQSELRQDRLNSPPRGIPEPQWRAREVIPTTERDFNR